jgi:hypothetical protein
MSAPVAGHQTTSNVVQDAAPATISRWSDLHVDVSNPAAVVVPKCESDIVAAIRHAKRHNLTVVVGGGGHATFVPVDSSTLYLDMKEFQAIEIDADAGVVRVGGGVSTGTLLHRLTEQGLYTPLCDSNAVGNVGCLLGAGNTPHVGINGYMVDSAVGFRVVTADEETIEVDATCTGENLALFNALCGAGHGHGVVVSATSRVHPLAALGLTDNKIWSMVMMFQPQALESAIKAHLALQPGPGPLYCQLVFNRGPPDSNMAGHPVIVLSIMYLGPAADAEQAVSSALAGDVRSAAAQVDTQMIDVLSINNALEPLNVHGGLKSTNGARLTRLTAGMIRSAFSKWLSITDALSDSHLSLVSFQSFNPRVLQANGDSGPGKDMFLEARDRSHIMVVATWCSSTDSNSKLARYVDDVLQTCRQEDGAQPRTIPNTMRYKEPLENLFTKERIAELQRLKKHWDPTGVFWSPYVGAYRDE